MLGCFGFLLNDYKTSWFLHSPLFGALCWKLSAGTFFVSSIRMFVVMDVGYGRVDELLDVRVLKPYTMTWFLNPLCSMWSLFW